MKKQLMILLAIAMITARGGVFNFNGHKETWYDRPMKRVCARALNNGIVGAYWEREDGMKMYGEYIICAGAPERYGEVVETSRGLGIILDTGTFAKKEPTTIDIATTW